MRELYDNLNVCWQFAKTIFEKPPTSVKDYSVLYEVQKEIVELRMTNGKANKNSNLVRKVTNAILEYYEEVKHEQINGHSSESKCSVNKQC